MSDGPRQLLQYGIAWFGMMVLAIVNGAVRDGVYAARTGELRAHQIATGILLVLIGGYFWILGRFWPVPSAGRAWAVGALWLVMTLAFEVALGRLIAGHSWQRILHEYNLLAGRVWVLVPLWVLVAPYALFRLRQG